MLAFLIGTITKENDNVVCVTVEDLYYPPQEAGEDYVSWQPNDIVRLQAKVLPRAILGSIHSHPNCEPHLSVEDIKTAEQFGDTVVGVFSYWKPTEDSRRRVTSLDFYYGARMLECRIL